MKALTLNHDGYARSAPDTIQLTDLSEFVTLNDIDVPAPKAGEVKIFEYVTSFNYEAPPPPQFRRGAGPTGLSSLSMRVQFHEACVPQSVTWSRWSNHQSDDQTTVEEVVLDGDLSAHRFVSSLQNEVVGFTWAW